MAIIIASIQNSLMLICRVQLVLFILKQHLISAYCFTVKQEGLIVIKSRAFTFTALLFQFFFSIFTNSAMIFPPSSFFIIPVTFLFFPTGKGLLFLLNIHLYQSFSLRLLESLCENFLSLSNTQSCLCPYSISLL